MSIEKLTEEEIARLTRQWNSEEEVWFDESMSQGALATYFENLRYQKVIEIGPGSAPINEIYPCKEYIGVQPFKSERPDLGYELKDGLSFLRSQPSANAVIVSFGIFDEDVLVRRRKRPDAKIAKRYILEMGREIKRVMHPYAIILGIDAVKYIEQPDIPFIAKNNLGGVYLTSNNHH